MGNDLELKFSRELVTANRRDLEREAGVKEAGNLRAALKRVRQNAGASASTDGRRGVGQYLPVDLYSSKRRARIRTPNDVAGAAEMLRARYRCLVIRPGRDDWRSEKFLGDFKIHYLLR
jgi:hypothetical protein